jgi:hypothetical protein
VATSNRRRRASKALTVRNQLPRVRASAGAIPGALDQANLGDRIAAIGPWQGETTDEVIELLREGRDETHRKLPDLV